MKKQTSKNIIDHFEKLEDPRIDRTKLHKLIDIIVITICAVICGAKTWEAVELVGKEKYDWFSLFLELPNGIPSSYTFRRVFTLLNPLQFKNCFLSWIKAIRKTTKGEVISIDGKTLRRSFDKSSNKACIHMVSAWASKNHMVLGQIKTTEKSNEITAIPQLLKLIEIQGCIVTIDAMGCQKNIAKDIIDNKGDYILALKGNQGTLHNEVIQYFDYCFEINFKDVEYDYYKEIDTGHGRIEKREYWIVTTLDWYTDKNLWKSIGGIIMVKAEREINGEKTSELRYYITSLDRDVKKVADAVRSHWGIENSLHWVLDITFREDESRMRTGDLPENFAMIRHIALNLLKQDKMTKKSIPQKQFKAALNNDYLSKVFFGI
jgi:predicted transposase YbfD/YdcC